MLLAGILNVAKADDESTLLPEGYVPIDFGKAGASASIQFHVGWLYRDKPRVVVFTFMGPKVPVPVTPKSYQEFTESRSYQDYMKILESMISAGNLVHAFPGWAPPARRGIHVRITWSEKNGKVLGTREVYQDRPYKNLNDFVLDHLVLPVGDYVVTVTALEDDNRFDGTYRTAIYLENVGWFVK